MANVVLAVYDISRGMARTLGSQFLGMEIDMIPHTGVVVFGKEYFFGGGIQVLEHDSFVASQGLAPVQMINMGTTNVSQHLFEEFLASIRPRFTMETYDLITNNCNNFSDEVCRFLVSARVPEEIIGLPNRVFSSPMGQMLRPMVEQAQGQMRGNSLVPGFAENTPTLPPSTQARASPQSRPAASNNPWAQQSASGPPASAPANNPTNPWATPASKPNNPWADAASTSSNPWAATPAAHAPIGRSDNNAAAASARAAAVAAAIETDKAAAVAATEAKAGLEARQPLLSANAAAVPALVKQLKAIASFPSTPSSTPSSSPSSPPSSSPTAPASPTLARAASSSSLLSTSDTDTLDRLGEALVNRAAVPGKSFAFLHAVIVEWPTKLMNRSRETRQSAAAAAAAAGSDGGRCEKEEAEAEAARAAGKKAELLALCLLRLLVLQPSAYAYMLNDGASRTTCLARVLDVDLRGLAGGDDAGVAAMRFAVFANLFALPSGVEVVVKDPQRLRSLIAAAAQELQRLAPPPSPPNGHGGGGGGAASAGVTDSPPSSPSSSGSSSGGGGGSVEFGARTDVRQMAAAALHNTALALPLPHKTTSGALSGDATEVLRASAGALSSECDDVTLQRRTLTVAVVLHRQGPPAVDFIRSSGLNLEIARALARAFKEIGSSEETKTALREVNRMLS